MSLSSREQTPIGVFDTNKQNKRLVYLAEIKHRIFISRKCHAGCCIDHQVGSCPHRRLVIMDLFYSVSFNFLVQSVTTCLTPLQISANMILCLLHLICILPIKIVIIVLLCDFISTKDLMSFCIEYYYL
jgi:hypothetical protein